ncbi:LOW QUALITY PROTEIN: nostrin-like [Amphiura filiformis]|uniref:LOW QUALITY PROTEIN: nostrin-like n=1 Tax=Amphiura filiformis TaxID=82378 RepID=UPI003B2260AB
MLKRRSTHGAFTLSRDFKKKGTHFKPAFIDEEGYDELRKHMKVAHDFSKDLLAILAERAELESTYAKGLSKLATKSTKASKDTVGSLMSAWNIVCVQLGAEAEAHRVYGEMLHEEVHKPLKLSVDQQVKNRRTSMGDRREAVLKVEVTVDKAIKTLHDKKNELLRAKKATHTKAKDSEHMAIQLEDPSQRGKILSDKEVSKLRSKTKKAEEQATKADMDYLELIKNCERARHEMDRTLVRAVLALENQELERITEQKQMITKYSEGLAAIEPTLHTCIEELSRAASAISVDGDIVAIANAKGKEAKPQDQLLYDSYEEDLNNTMNVERRRTLLDRKLRTLDTEISREQRAREGIAKLCGAYTDTPGFADENARQDATQQLGHSNDMLNVLRASRFKIMAAKAFIDKQDKPDDDISSYIAFDKAKQSPVSGWRRLSLGRNSTLRIPKNAPPLSPMAETIAGGRGSGDGHSGGDASSVTTRERPPSFSDRRSMRMTSTDSFMSDTSFDDNDDNPDGVEYGNVNRDNEQNTPSIPLINEVPPVRQEEPPVPLPEPPAAEPLAENGAPDTNPFTGETEPVASVDQVIGQCRVLYDYDGQEEEELIIRENDVINLYEKDEDGWWRGELNGAVGIFPGSYVEEITGCSTDL